MRLNKRLNESMITVTPDKDRASVLVVEDEALQLLAATDLLIDAGFGAVGIGSADEALKILKGSDRFFAVVTDIDLPGEVNGFGVAWCAHSLGIAVVIVSGRVTPSPDLLPPGSVFFAKPVDGDELIRALRNSLRRLESGDDRTADTKPF